MKPDGSCSHPPLFSYSGSNGDSTGFDASVFFNKLPSGLSGQHSDEMARISRKLNFQVLFGIIFSKPTRTLLRIISSVLVALCVCVRERERERERDRETERERERQTHTHTHSEPECE